MLCDATHYPVTVTAASVNPGTRIFTGSKGKLQARGDQRVVCNARRVKTMLNTSLRARRACRARRARRASVDLSPLIVARAPDAGTSSSRSPPGLGRSPGGADADPRPRASALRNPVSACAGASEMRCQAVQWPPIPISVANTAGYPARCGLVWGV